ncbi:MAG TPA: dTDP-4-dehydrorhamnose 3,5-epimerase family protein [Mycobacteriales bacterium]|nr:dTDP-4-dehydrorhamnose 3,5-epimerase family protein [Mycobacteriales bacterium]
MDVTELSIPGAWVFTPRQHPDERGLFLEWFKAEVVEKAIGHPPQVVQANHSISRKDVLRGVHYAQHPPSQAKYVYCTRGAFLDVVVDIRVGSPTFGRHEAVRIDDVDRRGVYLAQGLGHAILALEDDSAVTYLVSTPFTPANEHGVHPLDPALGIAWGAAAPLLSPKDEAAPSLADAAAQGLLPSYDECAAYVRTLGAGT